MLLSIEVEVSDESVADDVKTLLSYMGDNVTVKVVRR